MVPVPRCRVLPPIDLYADAHLPTLDLAPGERLIIKANDEQARLPAFPDPLPATATGEERRRDGRAWCDRLRRTTVPVDLLLPAEMNSRQLAGVLEFCIDADPKLHRHAMPEGLNPFYTHAWLDRTLRQALRHDLDLDNEFSSSNALATQEMLVAVLLAAGACPDHSGLRDVAMQGNPRLVQRVLAVPPRDQQRWDLGHPEVQGRGSPFEGACSGNNWNTAGEIVGLLVTAGAEVDPPLLDGEAFTPLIQAVNSFNRAMTLALLEHGADPDRPDRRGQSALNLAAQNNDVVSTRLLLVAGANPTRCSLPQPGDGPPWSPIRVAAHHGSVEVLQTLLEHGVDPFPPMNPNDPESPLDESLLDIARTSLNNAQRASEQEHRREVLSLLEQVRLTRLVKGLDGDSIRPRARL